MKITLIILGFLIVVLTSLLLVTVPNYAGREVSSEKVSHSSATKSHKI